MAKVDEIAYGTQTPLPAGLWHFGDAEALLGTEPLASISTTRGPMRIQRDGEIVGIVARSEDMPSGWSCITRQKPSTHAEGTVTCIDLTASVRFVDKVVSPFAGFDHPEHDRLEIHDGNSTILSLN